MNDSQAYVTPVFKKGDSSEVTNISHMHNMQTNGMYNQTPVTVFALLSLINNKAATRFYF